jgi:hypothetical protein
MPDGVWNAWNISSNKKSGTDIKIPYSDLARAKNSWFGNTYGTVQVKCKDGDNNSWTLKSTNMSTPQKVKVFFPPNVNVDGNTTFTASKPPCWFKFWKDGKVIDGISDFNFDPTSTSNAYYVPRSNKLYFCRGAFEYPRQQFTFITPTRDVFVAGSNEEYIDGVAALIPHEKYHQYCRNTWSRVGTVAIRAGHNDTDALPDNEEITPSKSYFKASQPNNSDTFSIHTLATNAVIYKSYGDQEVRCRLEEIHNKPKVYKEKDWAADSRNLNW